MKQFLYDKEEWQHTRDPSFEYRVSDQQGEKGEGEKESKRLVLAYESHWDRCGREEGVERAKHASVGRRVTRIRRHHDEIEFRTRMIKFLF